MSRKRSIIYCTVLRVEVEIQEKGNIGNKPGFFACFVSMKQ